MRILLVMILSFICLPVMSFEESKSRREVVLENDTVQVVRLTYPVGTESGFHTHIHPNRVVYFVTGGLLELSYEDKQKPSKVINAKDGQTLFLPASRHNVKNIGSSKVILVETEIKKK